MSVGVIMMVATIFLTYTVAVTARVAFAVALGPLALGFTFMAILAALLVALAYIWHYAEKCDE